MCENLMFAELSIFEAPSGEIAAFSGYSQCTINGALAKASYLIFLSTASIVPPLARDSPGVDDLLTVFPFRGGACFHSLPLHRVVDFAADIVLLSSVEIALCTFLESSSQTSSSDVLVSTHLLRLPLSHPDNPRRYPPGTFANQRLSFLGLA